MSSGGNLKKLINGIVYDIYLWIWTVSFLPSCDRAPSQLLFSKHRLPLFSLFSTRYASLWFYNARESSVHGKILLHGLSLRLVGSLVSTTQHGWKLSFSTLVWENIFWEAETFFIGCVC